MTEKQTKTFLKRFDKHLHCLKNTRSVKAKVMEALNCGDCPFGAIDCFDCIRTDGKDHMKSFWNLMCNRCWMGSEAYENNSSEYSSLFDYGFDTDSDRLARKTMKSMVQMAKKRFERRIK